jgi:hypothetical protein
MQRVRLIHWNAEEGAERAGRLRTLGYEVDHRPMRGPASVRELGDDPPAVILIDLARLPSQGRDMALLLRKRKSTRQVPLVFVGGKPGKVDPIKALLPDAAYAEWDQIETALGEAIESPPAQPVVPSSQFEAYAGKPVAEKLGVKAGAVVVLVGAPDGFETQLGTLPEDVQFLRQGRGRHDLTIWFVRSCSELEGEIAGMIPLAQDAPLWIAWPKKSSGVATDLTQQVVREVGLAAGLVDYKICAIDRTWSALLFTQRKAA